MSRDLLRLVTAGSVDDGKSTLVGRLLHDTKSVLADQLDAVRRASEERGLAELDLSLLVDGLRAEREQGITIDVAYRYFATDRRTFVMADTPGHVQYTKNTVTGASTADHAILLVDARAGVIDQTRRHLAVMALLRVGGITLAVNKLDLVGYDRARFEAIRDEFAADAEALGYDPCRIHAVPLSALEGDNVVIPSRNTPWYDGPTLLQRLEEVPPLDPATTGLRMAIQYVLRRDGSEQRGYAGQIAAGRVAVGDAVVVAPAGRRTRVERIDTPDGPVPEAVAGDAVGLVLADHVDVSRGDLVVAADDAPETTDEFDATVCWLSEGSLAAGSRLLLKHGTRTVSAQVLSLCARLDERDLRLVDTPESFELNDIGRVRLRVSEGLALDPYSECRYTGAFLLLDRRNGDTLAGGLLGATPARSGSTS